MEKDILKILQVINKTANALYPNKYVVTVSDTGNLGLYYPESKRIVSSITITEEGTVLFFNNCNDLMDDFLEIEAKVNSILETNSLKDNKKSTFYTLKLGDYFMKFNSQLMTYSNPKLTNIFENALVFTDDDLEDDFKDAVDYYLSKGFKMCKVNFEEE